MKFAVLLSAVALASGSALAASNGSTYDNRDTATTHKAPVVVKHRKATTANAQPKEGIVDRTQGAIRRMGEKLGHATERLPGKRSSNQAANDPSRTDVSRSDTRSMGAAGSDESDRRRRMDDAYGNWHTRQR